MVSSSGESVEGLLAFHADSYFIVPDPARGTAAKFLGLEEDENVFINLPGKLV